MVVTADKAQIMVSLLYQLSPLQAGDTQEMLGVEKFFLAQPRTNPLHVGSVKSNMGHSEPSSGIAALAKVLLAYYYKKIPANIHFQSPNPKVGEETTNTTT